MLQTDSTVLYINICTNKVGIRLIDFKLNKHELYPKGIAINFIITLYSIVQVPSCSSSKSSLEEFLDRYPLLKLIGCPEHVSSDM